jgi:hypothetical protein
MKEPMGIIEKGGERETQQCSKYSTLPVNCTKTHKDIFSNVNNLDLKSKCRIQELCF